MHLNHNLRKKIYDMIEKIRLKEYATRISDQIYSINGYEYDLEEMCINIEDDIFDKIVRKEELKNWEKDLIIYDGDREWLYNYMDNQRGNNQIFVYKILIMLSDHDGYCSGNESEFDGQIKCLIWREGTPRNINDVLDLYCEKQITGYGSGYCSIDEISEKYDIGMHDFRLEILAEYVM